MSANEQALLQALRLALSRGTGVGYSPSQAQDSLVDLMQRSALVDADEVVFDRDRNSTRETGF